MRDCFNCRSVQGDFSFKHVNNVGTMISSHSHGALARTPPAKPPRSHDRPKTFNFVVSVTVFTKPRCSANCTHSASDCRILRVVPRLRNYSGLATYSLAFLDFPKWCAPFPPGDLEFGTTTVFASGAAHLMSLHAALRFGSSLANIDQSFTRLHHDLPPHSLQAQNPGPSRLPPSQLLLPHPLSAAGAQPLQEDHVLP